MWAARVMSVAITVASLATASVPLPAQAASPDERALEAKGLHDRLGAIEDGAYAAWKAGDRRFWSDALSDRFVGWGPGGRIGKPDAVARLGGAACRIASYRLSEKQVTRLTPDIALMTHRAEVDGACGGTPLATPARVATVFVREAGRWKIAYRAQSTIVDPMKATPPAQSEVWTSGQTSADPATRTLLDRETAVVTAWKNRDGARMGALFGPELQFVDIFGNHLGSRADALKAWSGEGCDVKSFAFTGAKATMPVPDFGILTYRASYDAKCFGQDVWPIWGTAFYVRHGDTWLWSSGINVLAGAP